MSTRAHIRIYTRAHIRLNTRIDTRSKLEKYEEVGDKLYIRKYIGIGLCTIYKGSNP